MILRKVTLQDIPLLKHWDEQPHVIAAAPNDDWEWEEELRNDSEYAEYLIAELEGEPIGIVQIIDPHMEETHYWGEVPENLRAIDIWIGEAENLNKGYGTQMMNLAFDRCFGPQEVMGILIDPLKTNTKAHRFYERLGFKFVEERRFEEDDCFVYELKREDWEAGK